MKTTIITPDGVVRPAATEPLSRARVYPPSDLPRVHEIEAAKREQLQNDFRQLGRRWERIFPEKL